LRVVATRGSALALAQAELTINLLRALEPAGEFQLLVVDSDGDLNPSLPVPELEGQGWFSSRLERALSEGKVEAAVHSAKDLPTISPGGLTVGAYLAREDPRDSLVTVNGAPWRDLPTGSRVGTSSPRRAFQLQALRPDLQPVSIRGNIDTRLRRMGQLGLGAVMVAQAGLIRLGRGGQGQPLDPIEECTPAPAQGAIAVQVAANTAMAGLVSALDDASTRTCVEAERAVLVRMGGGCRLPLGVFAEPTKEGNFRLTVAWSPGDLAAAPQRLTVLATPGELVPRALALADQLLATR